MKVAIALAVAVVLVAIPIYFTLYVFESNVCKVIENGMESARSLREGGERVFPIDASISFVRTGFAIIYVVILLLIMMWFILVLLEVIFRFRGNAYIKGCIYNY